MTDGDDAYKNPTDNHKMHVWFVEPRKKRGVLTVDGITQIAQHKYVSGSYTYLDSYLSPNLWEPLTNLLPLWVAPNAITTFGGFWSMTVYILSTHYLDTGKIPNWLYIYNGICMIVYYTLDCMDGKQARRTKTSSPVGQLFDHGIDCLCTLSHLKLFQCISGVQPWEFLFLQCSLQFTFWQAQWEEYYTGILKHSNGKFLGVSEVNYGMAVWSILTGTLIKPDLYAIELATDVPFVSWLFDEQIIRVRHVLGFAWCTIMIGLLIFSWIRVKMHVNNTTLFLSAMSKLLSPTLVCFTALLGLNEKTIPMASLSMGLCLCLITIKLIVKSMARMAMASIQWDILPFCFMVIAAHLIKGKEAPLFYSLTVFYIFRLLYWVHKALTQLCERLNVRLFHIPYPIKAE